jgi:hypothetical protein
LLSQQLQTSESFSSAAPKAKLAAAYVRVSTSNRSRHGDEITFDQNPEVQQEPLQALIAQRGWSTHRIYSDRSSGAKEKRPGLDALMADARRGSFDVVVYRVGVDVPTGLAAAAGFIYSGHPSIAAVICVLAAGIDGYCDRNVTHVWIHGLVMMSPEILTLLLGTEFCDPSKSWGCGAFPVGPALVALFSLLLIGVSYVAFFGRRWFGP